MKDSIYVRLVLILPLPLLVFFEVPIQKTVEVWVYSIMKGVALLLFVGGLNKTDNVYRFMGLALSLWMTYVIFSEQNETYFLGEQIGERHLGVTADYAKLKVYQDGECSIATGGVLGIDSIFYCAYQLEGETIWLLTERQLRQFNNELVQVGEHTYQINRKMPIKRREDD